MTIKFVASLYPEALASVLSDLPSATVEAEYGDIVVPGTVLTLAHHGPRAGRSCPCLVDNMPLMGIEVVGISHLDLDTVGGIMAILGKKARLGDDEVETSDALFWRVAASIDLRGPHRLERVLRSERVWDWAPHAYIPLPEERKQVVREKLHAFWAWSEAHRLELPRQRPQGQPQLPMAELTVDATALVMEGVSVLEEIAYHHRDRIAAGRAWAAAKEALDSASYVMEVEGVILRRSESFTNHLYRGDGRAVVAFNEKLKTVTISLADPIPGVSCREVVQALWGPKAGGHDGIAGSPRGQEMTMDDARVAVAAMVMAMLGV